MSHHFPTKSPKHIVVIGGGMGGLAAAARLAKKGHKVSLFEAGERLGGKCQTEHLGAFAFDTGPSLLTLPAVYRDLFIKTGKRLEHLLELKPVDPAFEYVFHDGTQITFPNLSHNGTVSAIAQKLGPQAGEEWHRLLKRAESMWEASRESFIEGELRSIRPFLSRKSLIRDLRTIAPWKSLRAITRDYTENPYLSRIIDRYATYTGSDPRKVPGVLLTIAFVEEAFGAWHVSGGLGLLGEALAERAADLGVSVNLNSEVKSVQVVAGEATGVFLSDGRFVPADAVISNADATHLYNQLVGDVRGARKPRKSLKRATPSLSGFSILLALNGVSKLNHHTVYFPENYDDEFDAIFKDNKPPSDPAIYICNPRDSKMTPPGECESWFVLVNAPRHDPIHGTDWDAPSFKERYADFIIDKLESKGLQIRDRLREMAIRTPADIERDYRAPGGSIYGSSSNGLRSAFLRARNRSPIKNLYCVGGSAHPGGGLPLVALSAEIVAAAIEESS